MKIVNDVGKISHAEYTISLDKKNKKILSLLMANARFSYSWIAKKVKLSKNNVIRRISILEKKGLITGYETFIDISKLDINTGVLLLQTNCTEEQKEKYIKKLALLSWVYGLVELTGKFNILVAFYYKDENHKDFIVESIILLNYIKNFISFEITTFFPMLDYTKEVFEETLDLGIKGKDIGYTNVFKNKKEQRIIDSTDVKILSLLSDNCRMTLTDMGHKLKISRETVNYRIKNLIISGAITKFQPTVNLFILGFNGYFLLIKLAKPTKRNSFIKYLAGTKRCNTIIKSSGEYDIIAFIHFKSNKEFIYFEKEMISRYGETIYEYSFELVKHQEKLSWFPQEVKEYLIKLK